MMFSCKVQQCYVTKMLYSKVVFYPQVIRNDLFALGCY